MMAILIETKTFHDAVGKLTTELANKFEQMLVEITWYGLERKIRKGGNFCEGKLKILGTVACNMLRSSNDSYLEGNGLSCTQYKT